MKDTRWVVLLLLALVPGCRQSDLTGAMEAKDSRTPVPMSVDMALQQKANMRRHLDAMRGVAEGLANEDFAAVAKAARSVGHTPQTEQMCMAMGAGAEGFSTYAISFHKSADLIAEAAEKRDKKAVAKALAGTLGVCVTCHATYRQQLEPGGGPMKFMEAKGHQH